MLNTTDRRKLQNRHLLGINVSSFFCTWLHSNFTVFKFPHIFWHHIVFLLLSLSTFITSDWRRKSLKKNNLKEKRFGLFFKKLVLAVSIRGYSNNKKMWFLLFSVQDWSTFGAVCIIRSTFTATANSFCVLFYICMKRCSNHKNFYISLHLQMSVHERTRSLQGTAGEPSLRGHVWLLVRVSNPSTLRSDLVQSFTGPLTAEDNTWRMGRVHLAASFRSIMPSSAQRVGACVSAAVPQQIWGQAEWCWGGFFGREAILWRLFGDSGESLSETRLAQLKGRTRPQGQRSWSNLEVRQRTERKNPGCNMILSNRFHYYNYISGVFFL